jgi:hypothetical protein
MYNRINYNAGFIYVKEIRLRISEIKKFYFFSKKPIFQQKKKLAYQSGLILLPAVSAAS